MFQLKHAPSAVATRGSDSSFHNDPRQTREADGRGAFAGQAEVAETSKNGQTTRRDHVGTEDILEAGILVVCDVPADARLIESILSAAGYSRLTAVTVSRVVSILGT